jgi:hypothetical protein
MSSNDLVLSRAMPPPAANSNHTCYCKHEARKRRSQRTAPRRLQPELAGVSRTVAVP